MPIYARKKENEYTTAPEGLWPAVCCDVVDLGIVQSQFGPQEKIEIRWQLEEVDQKTGRRFLIVQRYTPSLHEKSRLRPMLEAWRGRKFSKEEEAQFDIEKLLGANCQLQIIHNVKDEGRVYANVQAVVPMHKNAAKLRVAEDYIRVVNRPKEYHNGNGSGAPVSDEYVPF
jgi:hypothetical protein